MTRAQRTELHNQLSHHAAGMRLSAGKSKAANKFHSKEYQRIRQELLASYKERKRPSPEVEAKRNARWRHYAAFGSIRWAIGSIGSIESLPTATLEAKQVAQTNTNQLLQLINLLNIR